MAEPENDLAALLAAARAGSPAALGQLLEGCRGYLLLLAQRELDGQLQAKGGASDLVQQTHLDALRDFARFQGETEDELRAWLGRLLRNNLIDFTRQYRATDKRDIGREVALDAGSSTVPGPRVTAPTPTPSRQVMARERAQQLHDAIQRLPEHYRQVIQLRYQDECSFEEIGQRLGLSVNAAQKLWGRAVERLKEELGETP